MTPESAKNEKSKRIIPLYDWVNGQVGDCFVVLASKQVARTKEGKHYYRLIFRDARREAGAIIWSESPFFTSCHEQWQVGKFYKIRAIYREGRFGPRLELERIREAVDVDRFDGFDSTICYPSPHFSPESLFEEIHSLSQSQLPRGPLKMLVQLILKQYRSELLQTPASHNDYGAYPGGLVEHTLSVLKMAIHLADHYYSEGADSEKTGIKPVGFSRPLVIAGAILHDIGKIRALGVQTVVPTSNPVAILIGHEILGRDIVIQSAPKVQLDGATQLQLEHIILSASRGLQGGATRVPVSLEAMLVHYCDYIDSTFNSARKLMASESPTVFNE